MNPDLEKYVNEARASGTSDDAIRAALRAAGWRDTDIENAFREPTVSAPRAPEAPAPAAEYYAQPPAGQGSSTPSYASEPARGRSGINKKAAAAMAVGIVIVFGGAAFAYFRYLAPRLSPDEVLARSLTAMQGVKTFAFKANAAATVNVPTSSAALFGGSAGNGSVSMTASSSGEVDLTNLPTANESIALELTSDLGPSQSFDGGAEFVALDNIYYVKLDKLDFNVGSQSDSTLAPFIAAIQLFTDQWFKIDPNAIARKFGTSGGAQYEQIQSSTQITAQKMQEIGQLAGNYKILSVSDVLPDETVSGEDSYHYRLAVDKDALKQFVDAAYRTVYGDTAPSSSFASIDQAASSAIDALNVNNLEVWIGKTDFLVYKMSADIKIEQPATSSAPAAGSVNLSLNDEMSDYNKPAGITAPADSKDLLEILDGFLGSQSSSTASGGPSSLQINIAPNSPLPVTPQFAVGSANATLPIWLQSNPSNTYSRGYSYSIAWNTPSWAVGMPVKIELYDGIAPCTYNNRYGPTYAACGSEVGSAPIYESAANPERYLWTIPSDIQPGIYTLVKFFNGAISGQSSQFTVR